MICQQCQQAGLRSTVMETGGITTLVHYPPAWDETGKPLPPGRNRTTSYYTCSNGHQWTDSTDEAGS